MRIQRHEVLTDRIVRRASFCLAFGKQRVEWRTFLRASRALLAIAMFRSALSLRGKRQPKVSCVMRTGRRTTWEGLLSVGACLQP
jgi:hypothetical protein